MTPAHRPEAGNGGHFFLTRSGSSICPRCLRVTCPRSLTQWFGTWWGIVFIAVVLGTPSGSVFSRSLFCSFGVDAPFPGVRRSRLVCSATLQDCLRVAEASSHGLQGYWRQWNPAAKLLVNFRGKFFQFSFVREAFLGGSMLQDQEGSWPGAAFQFVHTRDEVQYSATTRSAKGSP